MEKESNKKSSKKKLTVKNALFIYDEDGFYNVSLAFLKALDYEQAVGLGLNTLEQLRMLMVKDSVENRKSLINGVEVTVGLNNTLNKLQRIFPEILEQIHEIDQDSNPHKLYVC